MPRDKATSCLFNQSQPRKISQNLRILERRNAVTRIGELFISLNILVDVKCKVFAKHDIRVKI